MGTCLHNQTRISDGNSELPRGDRRQRVRTFAKPDRPRPEGAKSMLKSDLIRILRRCNLLLGLSNHSAHQDLSKLTLWEEFLSCISAKECQISEYEVFFSTHDVISPFSPLFAPIAAFLTENTSERPIINGLDFRHNSSIQFKNHLLILYLFPSNTRCCFANFIAVSSRVK